MVGKSPPVRKRLTEKATVADLVCSCLIFDVEACNFLTKGCERSRYAYVDFHRMVLGNDDVFIRAIDPLATAGSASFPLVYNIRPIARGVGIRFHAQIEISHMSSTHGRLLPPDGRGRTRFKFLQ
jgi:hypothetical protein